MEDKLYWYKAKCTNVVDGDTIDAEIYLGFTASVKVRLRIYQDEGTYFDTPETKMYKGVTEEHKEHGLQAKARAEELLLGKDIFVKSYKKGSFRWLGEIWLEDGTSYAQTMINEGFQKKNKY